MFTSIATHLLESTIFAAACALAAFTLRRHRAAVRHGLWLAASAKFLVPFALLAAIGSQVSWRPMIPAPLRVEVRVAQDAARQPLLRINAPDRPAETAPAPARTGAAWIPRAAISIWLLGVLFMAATWMRQWRRAARIARTATPLVDGREIGIVRRLESLSGRRPGLHVLATDGRIEPGVFGIVRPVLLWPRDIGTRLDDSQIESIVAHEIAHVARRDNLWAAFHAIVQAAFWFHPVVWWIGARLVDERERACDEAVVDLGSEPEVYAASILETCRFSLEQPPMCVAGVSGADLRTRIQAIMRREPGRALTTSRRVALAVSGIAAIAVPVAVGIVNAPPLAAQSQTPEAPRPSFEVATVKVNASGDIASRIGVQPGGRFNVTNAPLRGLIRNAYVLQDFQLVGGPDWIATTRFDIVAKAASEPTMTAPGTLGPVQLMLQSLLAERFRLEVHRETREMAAYALVPARSDRRLGPQLNVASVDCQTLMRGALARGAAPPPPAAGGRPVCGMRIGPGQLLGGGFPLSQLATALSQFSQRIVIDRTGLEGNYDIELKWTPDRMPQGPAGRGDFPPVDPNGPDLFTAIQEQLGLKLESIKAPIDVLVIDKVEMPTPD